MPGIIQYFPSILLLCLNATSLCRGTIYILMTFTHDCLHHIFINKLLICTLVSSLSLPSYYTDLFHIFDNWKWWPSIIFISPFGALRVDLSLFPDNNIILDHACKNSLIKNMTADYFILLLFLVMRVCKHKITSWDWTMEALMYHAQLVMGFYIQLFLSEKKIQPPGNSWWSLLVTQNSVSLPLLYHKGFCTEDSMNTSIKRLAVNKDLCSFPLRDLCLSYFSFPSELVFHIVFLYIDFNIL